MSSRLSGGEGFARFPRPVRPQAGLVRDSAGLVRDSAGLVRHGFEMLDLQLAFLWQMPPIPLRRLVEFVRAGDLPFPCSAGEAARYVPDLGSRFETDLSGVPAAPALAEIAESMFRDGIRLLREGDDGWPERISRIFDPPPFLFVQGDPWARPASKRVAVVGSRAASATGREISYALGRDLAFSGVTVVSGLARGIDGEAHRGALDAGGRTVAVLGTGPDLVYPAEHRDLRDRILAQGGTVTEFPPGTPPRPLHFPRRNRILAALCDVVVVVEGSERSGARSTADFALDQGCELMAVPRDICLTGSVLPNRLLRDGAAPVLGVASILEVLEARPVPDAFRDDTDGPSASVGERRAGNESGVPGSIDEASVLASLRRGARDLDHMIRDLGAREPGLVQAILARLELLGRVERLPGPRYRLPACDGAQSSMSRPGKGSGAN